MVGEKAAEARRLMGKVIQAFLPVSRLLHDHTGGDGLVCAGVDEDEGPGAAVAAVRVVNERHRGAQSDTADVVHRETINSFDFMQRVDVDMVFHLLDNRLGFLGGVADDQFCLGWHGLVGEPADHRLDVLGDLGRVVGFDERVTS